MILVTILCIIFSGVILSPLAKRLPMRLQGFVIPLPAIAAFITLCAGAAPVVLAGESLIFVKEWVPQLGLEFSLRLNGLGLMLAMLVTGIGSFIFIYAMGYMKGYEQRHRLFTYLYAFMFGMAGLAFADHLMLLFVFWELTSITSYLLIGFNHYNESARRNALQALLVTGLGGMALLAGFILMANAAGTWSIHAMVQSGEGLTAHAHYPAILTLILIGAFTKSAQFPFHFWLPNAMAAPTPVSAYLHSATMVKAGVFLLALLSPVLAGTQAWTATLCTCGGITMLLGGFFGLKQTDLKKILAGTTLAVLGLITVLLGIGGKYGTLAAILVLLGHAMYKATLFMVAGSIDHETGTRDVRALGSLRKVMPWTAGAALLAGISKMGLPPFYGFLGKEYAYKAGLKTDFSWAVNAVILVGSAILLALAVKTAVIPFWRKKSFSGLPKHPHEAPVSMLAGPIVLSVLGLVTGIIPGLLAPLVSAAHSTSLGHSVNYEVKLWAGFNLPLLLSAITVTLGFVIYRFSDKIGAALSASKLPAADEVYQSLLDRIIRFANWQTRMLQSGYLRNYILIVMAATIALIVNKLILFGDSTAVPSSLPLSIPIVVMSVLMFVSIALALTTHSRLTALISLGVIGFGVSLIFAVYSAPDLAITQILVETLTVVLFGWVVYKLPDFRTMSSVKTRIFDAVVAVISGAVITVLILKSNVVELGPGMSDQLAAMSLPKAYGANVVNVILVDFRALDTWGEVTVLAIAALGVTALLKNKASNNANKK